MAALGTYLALAMFTTPLCTLPGLAAVLGAGPGAQTWVLSSMSVGLAAGLLVSGGLADDYGYRRLFVLGAAVMALTSVAGVLAAAPTLFVLGRIGQGVGAAALISCGLGLLGRAFPPGPDRVRATGVWGACVGAGIASGPPVAALLSSSLGRDLGWRAPYLLIALFTGVLAVAARLLLVESRAVRPRRVDLPGALLLGIGLSVLLAGLVVGRDGWAHPVTLGLLVAGLALLAAFALVERRVGLRGGNPLLDPRLFRRPDFVAVTAAGLATGMGVIAAMSFIPVVIGRGMGYSTLVAATAVVVWSGLSVPVALVSRRLKLSGDVQLALGLLGVAGGLALLTGLQPGDGPVRLLPGLAAAGIGSGVLNAALGRQAVASVPPDRAGMGSGANNTARYLGSALGVTIVSVIANHPDTAGLFDGWNVAVLVTAGFSVLGAAAVLLCLRRSARA